LRTVGIIVASNDISVFGSEFALKIIDIVGPSVVALMIGHSCRDVPWRILKIEMTGALHRVVIVNSSNSVGSV
jgi:hypothetical protein